MYKLSRTHPPDKQVLRDISLSFLPGAKIGVLGLNGSGKSTLLRIMAGKDTGDRGEAPPAPGARVGLLEQEPHLDESKGGKGNVEDGGQGQGVRGRSRPGAGRQGGAARAGPTSRRTQGREGQRRGGRGGAGGHARPIQRAGRKLLGRARGRVRPPAGPDRRGRRVE